IRAHVVKGHRIGRIIGFPTANLDVDFLTLPKEGVYAAYASISATRFSAIMYVGTRPTFDNKSSDLVCEVYIMGFSNDLYGKWLTIRPIKRLREDIRFDSIEELKRQITIDVDRSIEILNNV
ncbi:MAG: riboflavin biosynthesis protein RibF, partial [Chlamydiae bacterium]